MKIAFYKAHEGTFVDKIIDIRTGFYGYSHVELVFSDGMCFSASYRDGQKCRFKKIDLDEKWEIVDLDIDMEEERQIRIRAGHYVGAKYDFFGILFWYVIPIRRQDKKKWWCSEIVSKLLNYEKIQVSPNYMAKRFELPRLINFKLKWTKNY